MFESVLVANRGEIAVRIIGTLRRMGIRSVAVYSDADRDARHVLEADVAVRIGPASPLESYLSIGRILDAARRTGAQAIHPGYGFLSENVAFVRACDDAGLTFIGPGAEAVELMGDKIRAKLAVMATGVPTVPGRTAPSMSDEALVEAALEIGFPVIVKPSAGGGGKGMRLVERAELLPEALISARREAITSFGDDALFIERFLTRPRHIEVQVLADSYGATLHLGERECSLQRRHQKVIEEAPSALLDDATRTRICASAVTTAQSVGYRSVGTVEFIVSSESPDEFFFMEMNTRLQVEHPVTEMITGLDLVEQQLRVAAGEHLSFQQGDLNLRGHSVEARIYAEDPAKGFLPTGGNVLLIQQPSSEGVRVDSSLTQGLVIGTNYDPMLAKVIAWGPDRATALARLDRALGDTIVLGVTTNITFLRALLANGDVQNGDLDTGLIERELENLVETKSEVGLPLEVSAAFALLRLFALQPHGPVLDRWDVPDVWRVGDGGSLCWNVAGLDGIRLEIILKGTTDEAIISVGQHRLAGEIDIVTLTGSVTDDMALGDGALRVTIDGRHSRVFVATSRDTTWLWMNGHSYVVRDQSRIPVGVDVARTNGEVRSPMPGAVIDVRVAPGDSVEIGDRLVVIEAMKMEHVLVAPFAGVATGVFASVGDQVAVDQLLIRVDAEVDLVDVITGERLERS